MGVKHSTGLSAPHIASVPNDDADRKSRIFNDQHECALHRLSFQTILAKYTTLNIDSFATRLNHQLEHYVCWKPDSGCIL